MSFAHYLMLALCGLLLCGLALPADAQRALNRGVHVVPAPGKVVIDGDLADWDNSGAILCTKDVANLADVESARISAMWDAENLYIGLVWRDSVPMVNKIDPVTMPGNGWRSDCVQMRLRMDGFISHLDAWYYSTGKSPAMSISYGRMGVEGGGQPKVDRPKNPMLLGAEQAFRVSPDGKGYTQEIKIPWAVLTLNGKMPKMDADLRVGIELMWGDASADGWPRSRVTDNLADGETQTDFFWTNEKAWGRLILEPKGNLSLPTPEWMRTAAPAPQGPVPITFNLPRESFVTIAIEDARGNRVKSLLGGIKYPAGAHTVYWSGLDDRNNVLPAGDYRWKGIYRDALSVNWLMSFYQPNSVTPWNNAAGTGAWGPDHGTLLTATAGDGRVFLGGQGAEAGNPLFACDENGHKVWNQKSGEPDHLAYVDGILYGYTTTSDINWLGITANGLMKFDGKTGQWLDIPAGEGKVTKRLPLLEGKETAGGFTADRSGLYLSVKGKDEIRVFDRTTFKPLRSYTVEGAGEVLADGAGHLLVLTPDSLVDVTLATGDTQVLAQGDFATAAALAVDMKKKRIYIAFGAPRHTIGVYQRTTKRAKLASTIGKAGGRTQNGWYDPSEGFYNPTGLTVDGSGRLWVVEKGYMPKRVSVWKDGRWQRDYIGDTAYGGGGLINPLDPTEAFYGGMVFKVDLATGASRLTQIGMVYPKGSERLGLKATEENLFSSSTEYISVCNGHAYVSSNRTPRTIYRKRADGRWTLCVYIDTEKKIAWCDANDDEIVGDDEVTTGAETAKWGSTDYWGMRPSQQLDLFFANGDTGLRLRPQRFTAAGTPIYDFAKFEPMAGECQNGIGLRDGSYNSGCQGERGEYFSEMRKSYPAGDARRTFWFRGENTGRWTFRLPAPGLVLYPFQAHGIADVPSLGGEVVCWVSDFGQRYLFTDDMLYVDQLFQDGRSVSDPWPDAPKRGFAANKMAPGQESFTGFFTRLQDGRYILTNGFTDCRVFQVEGLDSLTRLPGGALALKAGDLARAKEIQQYLASGAQGPVSLTLAKAATPLPLKGSVADWPRTPVRIAVDDARQAQVYSGYDAKNLYVAWDVTDASPMSNKASRPELAFKGGDSVDLMFRLPGGKLDDSAMHAGDLRLLITELDGATRAVLYREISAVKRPYTFDAFEGANRPNAVKMDEVRLAEEVQAVITKRDGGYLVQAAIPWTLLGATPQAGAEARIDFGVLFSDTAGGATALRSYWCNRDTNIVSDIPSEARLQPGFWGKVILGE